MFGAICKTINLEQYFNWPRPGIRKVKDKCWQKLAEDVLLYPEAKQQSWGIPFQMGTGNYHRVIMVVKGYPEVLIKLNGKADFLCLLHDWYQFPETIKRECPSEGLKVAEHEIIYEDGSKYVHPIRGRFEVKMYESPGPVWLAMPFYMWEVIDPVNYPQEIEWGNAQTGVKSGYGLPLIYAMPNPNPDKTIHSLIIRGIQESPYLLAGLTLYQGVSHPLRHLPRRIYRVTIPGKIFKKIEKAEIDLGGIVRLEQIKRSFSKKWQKTPNGIGLYDVEESVVRSESFIEAVGSEDATLSVKIEGNKKPLKFSLGETFNRGESTDISGKVKLQVLGKTRQWMRVVVKDLSIGKPVPVRIHFSGSHGEYIAPYGHPSQINTGWFMDYGADVVVGRHNFAYVPGEFMTDLPVGDLYVEIFKGFEYKPIRKKVIVMPGQDVLELTIERGTDWRSRGWVTADTHVHFISPHTASLQAQGEGINIVNLLASQWGRMFTNVGDFRGRVGLVEDDTIVYVGTENRNHMLGHISMLGTKGSPVFPMCCGGPEESWVGDPDFRTMAEWALENKRKGGIVIRPHYPVCGHTEDPVLILNGLVDALEINQLRSEDFPIQEWYRYLNCGYRVAVAGGTDKMGAYSPLGWLRTYAFIGKDCAFDYDNWANAVRLGRTFSTTGPLIDIMVEGRRIGDTIQVSSSGGTVEVEAFAENFWPISILYSGDLEAPTENFWPLGKLEIVYNGKVVAAETKRRTNLIRVKTKVKVDRSGWIAARCSGWDHSCGFTGAHTSPIYLKCGDTIAFDGPAIQHMLSLVNGGIEYLETLSTVFDEASKKRMVKLFKEARQELNGRLLLEMEK